MAMMVREGGQEYGGKKGKKGKMHKMPGGHMMSDKEMKAMKKKKGM